MSHTASRDQRKTQGSRILALLAEREWVPAYELSKLALQYNVRLMELRALGYVIQNRMSTVDGIRHSSFRLVKSPPQQQIKTPEPEHPLAPPLAPPELSLFDYALRHRDD